MTIFGYVCKSCGKTVELPDRRDVFPCSCGGLFVRDWSSINLRTPAFVPHFNHAVGKWVDSSRDFDHALARAGETQNATYERLDPGDFESIRPSKDTEVLETAAKVKRDSGLTPPPTRRTIV